MQPPNPTQTAAASLASLTENDETRLNGTVRNSQELPQTNHAAQSQNSHSAEESAAAAANSAQGPYNLDQDFLGSSRSLRGTASPPAFQTPRSEAVPAAPLTPSVTRDQLTASQCVVTQLDLLLENSNTLTTSDPSKRYALFSHLHAAISDNLTEVPKTADELRNFLQPSSGGLSHLTTLQVALAALQGLPEPLSAEIAELNNALQEPLASGITVKTLLDRSALCSTTRNLFLQTLETLPPLQQQSQLAKFSQTILRLKRALITTFMAMPTPAVAPKTTAGAQSDVWSALREHSLLLPLDPVVEEAHLQKSLQELQSYIDKKAQRGEQLSTRTKNALHKATLAMHKTRCMFNYIRANAKETYPTVQQGEFAYKSVCKARRLYIKSKINGEKSCMPDRSLRIKIFPYVETALMCMLNAGFCTEHAEITRLMLAKELQAGEAVCLKSEKNRDHLLTQFTVVDPDAAKDGKAQIIADSWNLGHAILYEDSIYTTQGLGCSVFSPLKLPEKAKKYVAHVEVILQNMINGGFFVDNKTMREELQEFRARHSEQQIKNPNMLTLKNVLAEDPPVSE